MKTTNNIMHQLDKQWKEPRPSSSCKEKAEKDNGIKKITTE